MPLHRGTRVVATRSLAAGRVPAGTVGWVIKVGFFGAYDVDFGRGRVLHDALRFPDGGSWWTRPFPRRR
jgi:hypothetical protein